MRAKKKAKKRLPKPVPCDRVAELVQAQEDGHKAGCRGSHAVAASWLADLVASLTGMHRRDVEMALGYQQSNGNAHFVRATDILREHFTPGAKRRKGATR